MRQFGRTLLLLICVSMVVFSLDSFIPGDPALMLAGESATREDIQRTRDQLGLDRPLAERYLVWAGKAVRGDVAESAREVEVATTAVRVLWRTLLAPVVPWAFALITLMCAACAVFGTALNHLVFGRAFR